MSPSPIEFPIMNEPAGISAMPSAVGGTRAKRKNLADEVLVTETAVCEPYVTGTASVAVTQFGATREVVLCKTPFVPLALAGQKRMA